MSRLLDESFLDPFGVFAKDPFFSSASLTSGLASMDMSETDGELSIQVDEVKKKTFYKKERSSGNFRRSVKLPSYLDMNKVDCEIKNGTLSIKIPKKNGANGKKSLKIKVK